jgi:hypothetical protein
MNSFEVAKAITAMVSDKRFQSDSRLLIMDTFAGYSVRQVGEVGRTFSIFKANPNSLKSRVAGCDCWVMLS